MGGYANRVVKLDFPHLSSDPKQDPIWVVIRNPKLMPPHELTPKGGGGIGPDGQPADLEKAEDATYSMIAKIIIGWRVYDASQPIELDAAGNDTTKQVLLPQGDHTAANCRKLPLEIIKAINREIGEAVNPH